MIAWEKLPEDMRNDAVRPYYDLLKKKGFSLACKRCFDVAASGAMIALLSPVLLGLAIWIKTDSEGPVFYRQERVTRYGKTFRIFKFRTMVTNADKIGSLVTTQGDVRITKVGRKIRSSRLDELPQLFNIFMGDMTFVGTRPEVRKYVDAYSDEMLATLLLPAGVTSPASIQFRNEDEKLSALIADGMTTDEAYIRHILPEKMEMNLQYLKDFTFFGDLGICIKTVI